LRNHQTAKSGGIGKVLPYCLLGIIVLAWVGWILAHGLPPYHLDDTDFQHNIGSALSALNTGSFYRFFWVDSNTPSLAYQVSGIIYKILGWNCDNFKTTPQDILNHGLLSQIPFLLVLLAALYGMTRKLFGKLSGLLSIVYFFSFCNVVILATRYTETLPATALMAAALCCLLYSDNFQKRGYALGYGIFLGLALLAGWLPGFLLLGISAVYFCSLAFGYIKNWLWRIGFLIWCSAFGLLASWLAAFRPYRLHIQSNSWAIFWLTIVSGLLFYLLSRRFFALLDKTRAVSLEARSPWLNYFAAILLAFVLSAWLNLSPKFILYNYTGFSLEAVWRTLSLDPQTMLQSLGQFFALGLSPFQLLFVLIGLGFTLIGLKARRDRQVYLLSLALALVLFALVQRKTPYDFPPLLLLLAPLAVGWIEGIKSFWRVVPICLLFLFGFANAINPMVYVPEYEEVTPGWMKAFYPQPYNITVELASFTKIPKSDGRSAETKNLYLVRPFVVSMEDKTDRKAMVQILSHLFSDQPEDSLKNFLPQVGNQRLEIIFCLPDQTLGKFNIMQKNVIYPPRPELKNYPYLVYLQDRDAPADRISQNLRDNLDISKSCNLLPVTRLTLWGLGRELVLYRIQTANKVKEP